MCPNNHDFYQNKKKNLILLKQTKKEINFFCRDFVVFTASLDESINLLYSM